MVVSLCRAMSLTFISTSPSVSFTLPFGHGYAWSGRGSTFWIVSLSLIWCLDSTCL